MKTIYRIIITAALFNDLAYAVGADTNVPDAGLLMRETAKSPNQIGPATEADIETPVLPKAMSAESNLRVKVENFNFSGNSQISSPELQALLVDYTHKELSFAELQQAVERISQFYRQAGFLVAYAFLPEQTLQNGQVDIMVVEGHIDGQHLQGETINLLNNTRINKQLLQAYLETLPAGSLITEQALNDLSLRINQIPGLNAKLVLAPGKTTGTSSLSLKVKEASLLNAYSAVDNYGLYATGYYRFDNGLTLNDPLGIGDQLNMRVQTTESGNAVTGWADYSAALNGYGTRFAVNFSELHYNLGRSFTPLDGNGIARTVGATLSQPLWLHRNSQVSAKVNYYHRWLQDNLDNVSPASHRDRELDAVNISLSGSLNDTWFSQPALTQATLSVIAGHVNFTNSQALISDQTTGLNERGGYDKFAWVLNRSQTLWEELSFYGNFYGQVAGKNLDSSERLSLGGPYGIRAYPVGEGNADQGWLANIELQYGWRVLPYELPGRIQVISFIDTGYSQANAFSLPRTPNTSQSLTGYGFGINWLEAKGFTLRTSLAWKDSSKPASSDPTAGNGPMAYFQLSRLF